MAATVSMHSHNYQHGRLAVPSVFAIIRLGYLVSAMLVVICSQPANGQLVAEGTNDVHFEHGTFIDDHFRNHVEAGTEHSVLRSNSPATVEPLLTPIAAEQPVLDNAERSWPAASVTGGLPAGEGAALMWSADDAPPEETCEHGRSRFACLDCPQLRYGYGDPDFPQRHVGRGDPMIGASWLNRPLHVDGFVGGLFGDNAVNLRGAVLAGVRLGWDLDHYWGLDLRWGYARPNMKNALGQGHFQALDTQLLYYPWGDSHLRPFVLVGSGIVRYTFVDDVRGPMSQVMYHLPIGFGLKYSLHRWLAIRMEFLDNIALGAPGNRVVNNYSISGGIEWHFGGRRRSYYPFDPDYVLR